jgi:phage gp29-like protein
MMAALVEHAPPTRTRTPGWAGRLWSAAGRFFWRDAPARRHSIARPRPLPEQAGSQEARDLKYGGYYQEHPGWGCTPGRVAAIFRQAELGAPGTQCDLFDDLVEADGTLRNLLGFRNTAVAGKPYTVKAGGPATEDERVARALEASCRALPMIGFFKHQLKFNRYGWGASNLVWGTRMLDGREWIVPTWIANVRQRRFRIDTTTDELLLVTDEKPTGEPLQPGCWCVTRGDESLARSGLMRTAALLALWKRFGTRDWLVFLEMFGIPLIQAIYADGSSGGGSASAEDRLVAEEIVEKFGSSGGAVTPESIKVQIHAARTGDAGGNHGQMIEFANREMAKLINGGTLANDNAQPGAGGSYAQASVHASVRWEAVEADAKLLEESIATQIVAPFLRFNNLEGKVAAPQLLIQVVQDLSPKTRLECADIARNKLGMPVSISQLRHDTGLREPLNPDDAAPGAPLPAAAPAKVAA